MTTTSTRPLATSGDDTLQAVLAPRARPARATTLSASLTFGSRTLLKIRHVPEQVFDVVAIPVVFTLMFTYLFGGALAGSTGDYLQDLLPGTLVMTVVLLTTFTGVGLTTDLASGAFDRFRTLPIWRPAPLVGPLVGDLGRYLIAATLVLVLGLAMGFRPQGGAVGVAAAVALALLFASSMSWAWTVIGLVARTPSAVNSISLAVLFPLTLASNTFVDPATMPRWLQAVVAVNPITHLVTAARGLMHGHATSSEIALVVLAAAVIFAVFAPLTMRLYRTRS